MHLIPRARLGLGLLLLLCSAGPAMAVDTVPRLQTQADPVAVETARQNPRQYAVAVRVDAGIADGQWQTRGGRRVWQLRVHAEGAAATAVHLEGLKLPPGAQLRWSLGDGSRAALWPQHRDGAWWSPEVPGDEGLLQISLPIDAEAPAGIQLRRVFHRMREDESATPRAAGRCNIDTACPEGDRWRAEAASTVRLTIDNRFLCTGALLDNTARDNRPLLISARHCGITPDTARSVNARFGFVREGCDQGETAEGMAVEGSVWIAESAEADTTLVELAALPVLPRAPAFAGWNAEPVAAGFPSDGAGLHHPSGDVRKISLYAGPARPDNGVDIGEGERRFRVDSWSVTWRQGVTEAGSSGSGLWNASRELVGVLSGGNSSCATPDGRDFYGRLERAYSSSPYLAAALDPIDNGQTRRLPPRVETRTDTLTGGEGLATGGGGYGLGLAILFGAVFLRRPRNRQRTDG
jgi:lysyl endopeptidase